MQIFKKSLEQIRSYEYASFLGSKWCIGSKGDFLGKVPYFATSIVILHYNKYEENA